MPSRHSTFGCYCSTCVAQIDLDGVLANPRYTLLAPTRVHGFIVEAKKWTTFPVRDLWPYSERMHFDLWNAVCLDRHVQLSLKEDFLRYFDKRRQALAPRTGPEIDIVPSSIRGLVVHFHGEPCRPILSPRNIRLTNTTGPQGVGKPLVAAALAAACQRQLIPLRPADLGTDIADFTKNLQRYLDLSFRWGAILLL